MLAQEPSIQTKKYSSATMYTALPTPKREAQLKLLALHAPRFSLLLSGDKAVGSKQARTLRGWRTRISAKEEQQEEETARCTSMCFLKTDVARLSLNENNFP